MGKKKFNVHDEEANEELGCILDENDPLGEAVCYIQKADGTRVHKTYTTDFSGEKIKITPQGGLTTPDGKDDTAASSRLDNFTKNKLPAFQKLLEIERG